MFSNSGEQRHDSAAFDDAHNAINPLTSLERFMAENNVNATGRGGGSINISCGSPYVGLVTN
ncbi:hypothetical protein MY11210_008434 [Beauveria gryllotalpidicola]